MVSATSQYSPLRLGARLDAHLTIPFILISTPSNPNPNPTENGLCFACLQSRESLEYIGGL